MRIVGVVQGQLDAIGFHDNTDTTSLPPHPAGYFPRLLRSVDIRSLRFLATCHAQLGMLASLEITDLQLMGFDGQIGDNR